MKYLLPVWTVLLMVTLPAHSDYITDQIEPVIGDFWTYLSDNKFFITSTEFSEFLARYSLLQNQESLRLAEVSFVFGNTTWVTDFINHGMSEEYSRAYYRLFDVYSGTLGLFRQLTVEDMDAIIKIIDKHVEAGGEGFLFEWQFKDGFREVLFRPVPFALMFTRASGDAQLSWFFDPLPIETFNTIFAAMDLDENGELTKAELGEYWDSYQYGEAATGEELFSLLDHTHKGFLNLTDWQELFQILNCRPYGKLWVDFDEFIQLDLILHGLRTFPDGECLLERLDHVPKM